MQFKKIEFFNLFLEIQKTIMVKLIKINLENNV